MSLRILLAEDHLLIRDGLKALLEASGLEVVGEASDGLEAERLARSLHPDVVVLDISMSGVNGVDAARRILDDAPELRIIFLTVHSEEPYVLEALRAGASGYVLKKQATADLVRAIREVSEGTIYLSPEISRAVVDAFRNGGDAPSDPLTPREREVLQLIAEGRTTKEIASVLTISVKTVETHRARMMEKLDLHDTARLVRYAIRRGLVEQ